MDAHQVDRLQAVRIKLLHLLHYFAQQVRVLLEYWIMLEMLDSLNEQKQIKVIDLEELRLVL